MSELMCLKLQTSSREVFKLNGEILKKISRKKISITKNPLQSIKKHWRIFNRFRIDLQREDHQIYKQC